MDVTTSQSPKPTLPNRLWFVLRGLGYTLSFALAGILASLVAALIGTLFVAAVLGGFAGVTLAVLIPVVAIFLAVPLGFIWSSPLTFFVFPLWVFCTRRQPVALLLGLGILGLVGGSTIMWLVAERVFRSPDVAIAFISAGGIAGLAAGMIYGKLSREILR